MLNIYLLGRLRVDSDYIPLKLPSLRKTIPLWAYLLLHAAAPVSRTVLCRIFWPDARDDVARTNLRRHLHQLRLALPPASPACPWLLIDTNSVQWNPHCNYWLDITAFEDASHRPESLAQAASLYEDDLLPELDDDWAMTERARLHDLYLNVLKRLVNQARMDLDHQAALKYTRLLLTDEPLDESAVRLLMTVRYEGGDRAGAIAEYEQLVTGLRHELGVDAMPETNALYRAILDNARLPSPSGLKPSGYTSAHLPSVALPFVGRERELERLKALWAAAAHSEGGMVLIGGEAGIGKTRLVTELAHAVEVGRTRILYGYTTFPEQTPYQAIITALRTAIPLLTNSGLSEIWFSAMLPLLPELAQHHQDLRPLAHLEPERERERLYTALRQCLTALAVTGPVLLILEDLHWAGRATISFLRYLNSYLSNLPVLLLATYREEEAGRSHPLRELRHELAGQRNANRHLAITRLPAEAATRAISGMAGLHNADASLIERLYIDSEGNPFYLGELINNLLEAAPAGQPVGSLATGSLLPASIRQVVNERTNRLKPNARLVAEIAAVVGMTFSVELIREVAGLEEVQVLAALDELLDRSIIREVSGGANNDYTFTHHLIQESIYEAVDKGVCRRRHRRLALVLEDLYPARLAELAPTLARHFDLGGDAARAVPYYEQAVVQATMVHADEEALEMAARILNLSDVPQMRWRSLCVQESIYQRQGNRTAQWAALTQMDELAEDLATADLVNEVLQRRISLHNTLGEREEQAGLIAQLTDRATNAGDQRWLAVALEQQANLYLQLGQYPPVGETVGRAIAIYQRLDDRQSQVGCYCLLVDCLIHMGKFEQAQELLARAAALSSLDDPIPLIRVLSAGAWAAVLQNHFSEASRLGQQLLDLCHRAQDRENEATALLILATAASATTHTEEAFTYFDQARQLCIALGKRSGEASALSNAAVLTIRLGRYEQGITMLTEAEAMYADLDNKRGQTICLINTAYAAIRHGDYQRAVTTARRGLVAVSATGSPYLEAGLLANLGHAQLELGEVGAAVVNMEAALQMQREIALLPDMIGCLSYLTVAYLRLGDQEAASVASAEALRLYPSLSTPMDDPQYLYWSAARLQHVLGNQELARSYLREARTLLDLELAALPHEQARAAHLATKLNRELLAACQQGRWPEQDVGTGSGFLPACPYCGKLAAVIRAGLNPSGSQRYRCKQCQLYFTSQRQPRGYDASTRARAVQLAHEGMSSRAIARELGVNYRSVINWTKEATPPSAPDRHLSADDRTANG